MSATLALRGAAETVPFVHGPPSRSRLVGVVLGAPWRVDGRGLWRAPPAGLTKTP
jgi:hypothetical protein